MKIITNINSKLIIDLINSIIKDSERYFKNTKSISSVLIEIDSNYFSTNKPLLKYIKTLNSKKLKQLYIKLITYFPK